MQSNMHTAGDFDAVGHCPGVCWHLAEDRWFPLALVETGLLSMTEIRVSFPQPLCM